MVFQISIGDLISLFAVIISMLRIIYMFGQQKVKVESNEKRSLQNEANIGALQRSNLTTKSGKKLVDEKLKQHDSWINELKRRRA